MWFFGRKRETLHAQHQARSQVLRFWAVKYIFREARFFYYMFGIYNRNFSGHNKIWVHCTWMFLVASSLHSTRVWNSFDSGRSTRPTKKFYRTSTYPYRDTFDCLHFKTVINTNGGVVALGEFAFAKMLDKTRLSCACVANCNNCEKRTWLHPLWSSQKVLQQWKMLLLLHCYRSSLSRATTSTLHYRT